MNSAQSSASRPLPNPRLRGERSFEETLAGRRSVREFSDESLSDTEISQLLWATQGVTDRAGLRTAPSAGALYPLEVYVATSSGLYRYIPAPHELIQCRDDDLRLAVHAAALGQDSIVEAAAVFVISAVYERTRTKYGARTERYVDMEVGHAAQNLLLQAAALDLCGVPIGAFDDTRLREALRLPDGELPLYLIPVGHAR